MSKKKHLRNNRPAPHSAGWGRVVPPWLACAIICAVGALVYSNTSQSSFHFDDETSIVNNPAIRQLSDLGTIFSYSPTRFITFLSFALNFAAHGQDVFGYHLVNLLIHVLSALGVWLLARQVLRTPAVSDTSAGRVSSLVPLLAALIFVAHPVQTQAVTYIAQRAASLATLFYVLSLYLYGEGRMGQLAGSSKTLVARYYAALIVSGLLAVFSKETALTLPFALILYEVFFFRTAQPARWGIIATVSGCFLLLPAVLIALGKVSLEVTGAIPATQYLLTQPKVWLTYLRLLILPVDLNLDYDFAITKSLFDVPTLSSIAGLMAIVITGFRLFNTRRVLSFCIFWFVITLLPESSLLPLPDVIFEHRLYLPMVGASIFAAALLYEFMKKSKFEFLVVVFAAVVGALGFATFERNKVWADDISLWSDVVKKSPMKPRAWLNLGRAFSERGRFNEANTSFNRALLIDPTYADVYGNRANVLVQQGQPDAAIADCNRALEFGGGLRYQVARIYFNRGTAYLFKGKIDSALTDLNKALEYDPNHPTAYFNRGIVHGQKGEQQKAIVDYTRALSLDPRNAKAFNNRGVILRDRGELNAALADFNTAVSMQPAFAQPFLNRGMVLSLKGELDRAIEEYSAFVKLLPNNPDGYYYRGVAYYRRQGYEKALSDFNQACAFNPSFGPAYADRAKVFVALRQYQAADSDVKRAKSLGAAVDKDLEAAVRRGMRR